MRVLLYEENLVSVERLVFFAKIDWIGRNIDLQVFTMDELKECIEYIGVTKLFMPGVVETISGEEDVAMFVNYHDLIKALLEKKKVILYFDENLKNSAVAVYLRFVHIMNIGMDMTTINP